MKKYIFNIIQNTIRLSENKNSVKLLGFLSFFESIIIPIPPDILLVPMVLSNRKKWLFFSVLCTVLSVIGGIAGYLIGYLFWGNLGSHIISFYNAGDEISVLKEQFSKYGLFIILFAGFTPLPYKIFTIGSGLLSFNFFIFIVCSLISRGLRFITLSYLVYKYGNRSLKFVEEYFYKLTIVFIVILSLIFLFYLYA
tara:strand:+ start:224 stop:811 length:588 start_codon:yes stop_codon:yes gene_type:complete